MSNYPSSYNTDLELPPSNDGLTPVSASVSNNLRSAIMALEHALGLDPQGNLATMTDRVNLVIDDNGNIKASALESAGLASTPLDNSDVDDAAAIAESKLDLDYSTTTLNSQNAQNGVDIEALRVSFNQSADDFIKHVTGVANRHPGNDIDLSSSIQGTTLLEDALSAVDAALTSHMADPTGAHAASAVSVLNTFTRITADTVQEALVALDLIDPGILEHQDEGHSNAVLVNNTAESGPASRNIGTLATTIYQTDKVGATTPGAVGTTNIVQIMQPNTARVTSLNVNMRAIVNSSADALRLQASGISRGTLDVDVSSLINSTNVDDLANVINTAAAAEYYPLSAYNTDGELTIAHNILGDGYDVEVLDTITNSADVVLGFADTIGTTFTHTGTQHAAYVAGVRVHTLDFLLDITYEGLSLTNVIAPGLGDLANYGMLLGDAGRVLVHITDHDTDDTANGSYYIQLRNTTDTFDLNANIPTGTFRIRIYNDSINFASSNNGRLYDVFLENAATSGFGTVSADLRADYLVISGMQIKSASNDFSTDSPEWLFNADETLQIQIGTGGDISLGEPVSVSSGFTGDLRVYAADGSSVVVSVIGTPGTPPLSRAITSSTYAGTPDRLQLSSVHYSDSVNADNSTVKFPEDKRKFGAASPIDYRNALAPTPTQDVISEIRSNGVIRGLDWLSNTTTTIRLRGGRALINGRMLDVTDQDVTVKDFTAGSHLVALDAHGKYQIYSGNNFDAMVGSDAYGDNRNIATVIEFTTSGSAITGDLIDRRLVVANLDRKIVNDLDTTNDRITQIENSFGGNMWGMTEAASAASIGTLETAANTGFTALDGTGFGGASGDSRRYELTSGDTQLDVIFKGTGMTHINVFLEVNYTDGDGTSPFGTSGEVTIYAGVEAIVGTAAPVSTEEYAEIRVIDTTVFPTNDTIERYVVSIPLELLGVADNVMFDIDTRIKITGSVLIDGGTGAGSDPEVDIGNIRVVTSTYSIAGSIAGLDAADIAFSTTIGDIF